MMDKRYSVRYRPEFYEDLLEIRLYIALEKKNPAAAKRLQDAIRSAIEKRVPFAESFARYHPSSEHVLAYYRIRVGEYYVFYTVKEAVMEVRRVLYGKRDFKSLLP